jgi:hypothetical protein
MNAKQQTGCTDSGQGNATPSAAASGKGEVESLRCGGVDVLAVMDRTIGRLRDLRELIECERPDAGMDDLRAAHDAVAELVSAGRELVAGIGTPTTQTVELVLDAVALRRFGIALAKVQP